MKVGEFFYIRDDKVVRRTPEEWGMETVFEMTVTPRDSLFTQPFIHVNTSIQIYTRKGRFLLEVEGETFKLGENEFFYIAANQRYRFRSLEISPALLHIHASSSAIEQDWRLTAKQLKV
jgi:mannose-6-phosphate isomerase-like protein (cupin superfamily)